MKTILITMLAACSLQAQVQLSVWAFGGADHRLHYRLDERGNSIMDFSAAGYRAGGVKLPSPPTAQRLTPAAGDNTARIQAALNTATGAVVLAPGEYEIAGTLTITRSGVVLRGEPGAALRLTGKPHRFLEIHGAGAWQEEAPPVPILDSYVPAGAASFRVRDPAGFHPGDRVLVLRAGDLADAVRTDRVVDSVEADRITLDVPLSDALNSASTNASLVRYRFPGRITEVGVESLRIVAAFDAPGAVPQDSALSMDAVEDAWVSDLEIHETPNGIAIGPTAKRVTLTNVRFIHAAAHNPVAVDFTLQGTQLLLDRCSTTGQATPVVTESQAIGPVVVLNYTADQGGVVPNPAWTTGLLVDGGKFSNTTERRPGVAFTTTTGWSVAWNVSSPFLLVQQRPGAINWCVGCIGTPVDLGNTPNGVFDSLGKMVHPSSLYLQQLRDRLGWDAVRNIGYTDRRLSLL